MRDGAEALGRSSKTRSTASKPSLLQSAQAPINIWGAPGAKGISHLSEAAPRSEALAALVPHLPAELLAEGLAATNDIANEKRRLEALVALAPQLPAELLGEALAAAKVMADEEGRSQALEKLAPHLPASLLREFLTAVLDSIPLLRRDKAFSLVTTTLENFITCGGVAVAEDIRKAISDVSRWYP